MDYIKPFLLNLIRKKFSFPIKEKMVEYTQVYLNKLYKLEFLSRTVLNITKNIPASIYKVLVF